MFKKMLNQKKHLVDKMGDMNIWQIWGEVYMND